jgi:AraC family transcriptional regulator
MPPDIGVAQIQYAAGEWQPRHAHEETTVSIVLSGSLLERVGRVDEVARPLSVVVKPGGTEHEDRFGPRGASTLQIRLSPDAAARLREWRSPLEQWRWIHGAPVVAPLLRVLRLLRCGHTGADVIEDAVEEVLGSLADGDVVVCRVPPGWLRLVREYIDDSSTPTPRVRDLARGAHVHPVHLAREFRRCFGVSITEYMQRCRVRRAAAFIADTPTPLASVSYLAGYADQSHFCRIFRRETGMTPLAFRRLVAAVPAAR